MKTQHIVNVSGGKDSGACLELALMRGIKFRSVMADTDNEARVTRDHVAALSERLIAHGQTPVELVKSDFSGRLKTKREHIQKNWSRAGVPQDRIDRALEILRPSGNVFLDLCLWKGRFPSRRSQFCTEFLKQDAIFRGVLEPALRRTPVVQWLGVRRDESPARARAPMFRKTRINGMYPLISFSPIIHWSGENAVNFAQNRGAPVNPLYYQGFTRVGCFPCINASKNEIARIGIHHPEEIAIRAEWEDLVADASKRGAATFFAAKTTPRGAALAKSDEAAASTDYPRIPEVVDWARTARGGKRRDPERDAELESTLCSSAYGLCE